MAKDAKADISPIEGFNIFRFEGGPGVFRSRSGYEVTYNKGVDVKIPAHIPREEVYAVGNVVLLAAALPAASPVAEPESEVIKNFRVDAQAAMNAALSATKVVGELQARLAHAEARVDVLEREVFMLKAQQVQERVEGGSDGDTAGAGS